MSTVKDTESAREFFKNDRYATDATGIEIMEARENYAKVCLKTEEKHQNAGAARSAFLKRRRVIYFLRRRRLRRTGRTPALRSVK